VINREYLDECFLYNEETGELIWKTRPREHFQTERCCNHTNSRQAGKVAGSYHRQKSRGGHRKIVVSVDGVLYHAHNLIWTLVNGYYPLDYNMVVDHINGDGFDNRLVNLRCVTQKDNMRNLKKYRTNTTGVTGVSFNKGKCKWEVYISRKYIASFVDFNEAVECRKKLEIEKDYHENHGR